MREFEDLDEFQDYISTSIIEEIAVQSLDLTQIEKLLLMKKFKNCVFLGCNINDKIFESLAPDNYIFPALKMPYNVYPSALYDKNTLYNNYDPNTPESYNLTLDKIVYDHYISFGKESRNIKETLARRLHDHSITDALYDFLDKYEDKKTIAIMGGHGLSRNSEAYYQVTMISKILTEDGYLLISGGGPGAMEATHLGAWFAGYAEKDLQEALDILSSAPTYDHPDWLSTSFLVLNKFSKPKYRSLGIPTWLYGHEPPTPFATDIAKYFANSVREEGLLAIAKGGVIFAPGSAGTMQEVFQDIAQNHYESFGFASPMVFLNVKYWSYDRPIYPVIELMTLRKNLKNLNIGTYDEIDDVVAHIKKFK